MLPLVVHAEHEVESAKEARIVTDSPSGLDVGPPGFGDRGSSRDAWAEWGDGAPPGMSVLACFAFWAIVFHGTSASIC